MGKMAVRNAAGAVLLIATVVAVAGCGGESKSSTPPPVTVTVAASTPTTTTTAAPTTTTTTTTSGLSGDCLKLATQGQQLSQALSGLSAGSTPAAIGKAADAYKAFAAQAPSEIRPAFQTIAAAFSKIAEAIKGFNYKAGGTPDPATLQKLQEVGTAFSAPDILAAEQKIAAWATSHCHA